MIKLVEEKTKERREHEKKNLFALQTSECLIGACHKCSLFPSDLLDIA